MSYAATADGNPAVAPFIDVQVPLSTLLAIELGEVLVHGYDIARAAGLPWTIEQSDALVAHRVFLALFHYLRDKTRSVGARVSAELRIRGMEPLLVSVHDGTLELEKGTDQRVDVTMSVEPKRVPADVLQPGGAVESDAAPKAAGVGSTAMEDPDLPVPLHDVTSWPSHHSGRPAISPRRSA